MHQWIRRQGSMGDDPPYLAVGTEVSAKYKGAFCEAKVRKVVRIVKCKVTFKQGLGTAVLTDDQVRGPLRVGAVCEGKHPEKKEYVEGTITKIQDCSQYTVVFDDGDITTLRRSALCLKSGRHFAESETLDQLPLTHPEHFSNPVIGGRKGRRSRQNHEESSDEEDSPKKGKKKEEKEEDAGKVVCVELGDKKKLKDNWFPGLVVAPTAQDTVRIRVRDDYLVRSFKDGRYYTVPKKEANEFTREIGNKVDNNTLKTAVEKALLYLDRDELPPHWDRDLLFGMNDTSCHSDSEGGMDSDSSDDEPREEKDHFVAQLYKFMDDRGTPINKGPTIGTRDVDLYKLFKVVHKLGGYNRVTNHNQWKTISHKMGFGQGSSSITNLVKQAYKKFLHSFEDFYRKLGCTMVNHPRGNRSLHRGGRSLIRDRDRATPIHSLKDKEKEKASTSTSTPASSLEKPIEVVGKNPPPPEKKEEEKPSEEKKEKEPLPKVKVEKEPVAKVKEKEPVAKVREKEPVAKVKEKEPVLKVKEQTPKAKEQSAKGKEQSPKGKDTATKSKEPTPKAKETSKVKEAISKAKEQVAKCKELTPKPKEQVPKAKELGPKGKEQTPKGKEQGSKTKEPVSKARESVSKAKETISKVKEQAAAKVEKTPPKTKEPVSKAKSKGKEKKEQLPKEETKQEKVKVKEESVDLSSIIQEVITVEKTVSEVKDEKVEELTREVTNEECEVTVITEGKSKGRAKDVKTVKEECIVTSEVTEVKGKGRSKDLKTVKEECVVDTPDGAEVKSKGKSKDFRTVKEGSVIDTPDGAEVKSKCRSKDLKIVKEECVFDTSEVTEVKSKGRSKDLKIVKEDIVVDTPDGAEVKSKGRSKDLKIVKLDSAFDTSEVTEVKSKVRSKDLKTVKEECVVDTSEVAEEKSKGRSTDMKPFKEECVVVTADVAEVKGKGRSKDSKTVEEECVVDASDEADVNSKGRFNDLKAVKEECVFDTADVLKSEEKLDVEIVSIDEEEEDKAKEEGIKIGEEQEKTDEIKKMEKKPEDDEKVQLQSTRSKSKEDLRCKKEAASMASSSTTTATITTTLPVTSVPPCPSSNPPPLPLEEEHTPEKDMEKNLSPSPLSKKDDDSPATPRKRGRKRKDIDGKGKTGQGMGQLASHIIVSVGDKLQVYYGPTHESKVTYEAKVLDIEEDSSERMYLVHYLGWNTRYDEWIKRGRIADNLSWTPSRAKRLRQQHAQLKKPIPGKRGRPSLSGRPQEGNSTQQAPRCTTPSSVTSSSSRTKSPAQRSGSSPRVTRNSGDTLPPGFEFRRRTRRMSGHTDISLPSETESDEEYEFELDVEGDQIKIKTENISGDVEKEDTPTLGDTDENRRSAMAMQKRITRRKDANDTLLHSCEEEEGDEEEDEEEDVDDEDEEEYEAEYEEEEDEEDREVQQAVLEDAIDVVEEEISSKEDNIDLLSTPLSGEKRRSKRGRKLLELSPDIKDMEVKQEPCKREPGAESEEEQPKGRDFDLNQIRSELKGIEKAVKLPVDLTDPETVKEGDVDEVLILDESDEIIVQKSEVDEEIVVVEEKTVTEKAPEKDSAEDVYEFKEPEPFEFEVRGKRESLLSDERGNKIPRRPIARLFDVEPKLETKTRKKLIRSPLKTEAKDISFEGDVKKRFRRSNKKIEEVPESAKVVLEAALDLETSNTISCVATAPPEPVTPQKTRPLSACEEAFDKLCESPSFHVASKPVKSPSPPPVLVLPVSEPEVESKTPELEQLSLLHDDGDDDDNEDRLIISETDDMETEIEEPLFSYPQRDHEELFPTLGSSEPSISSVEPSSCPAPPSEKSREPPLLSQINVDLFTSFSAGLESSSTEKSEGCKTPEKGDELGGDPDCGPELSSHANVDVMNLYSMDEDFEDDPINAAIRRVMSQNIMDEDTNDMDIFGGKQGLCSSFKQDVKPKSESPIPVAVDVIGIRRRRVCKKSILSQEFVESDTDSSDEEERLVIDKIDEESQPDEVSSSSSVLSMKLPVTEASEFDMKAFEVKVPLIEPEAEEAKDFEDSNVSEIVVQTVEEKNILLEVESKKGEEPAEKEEDEDSKKSSLQVDAKPSMEVVEDQPLVIPVIVDMELDYNPKKPDPDPDPGPQPPVIILEATLPEVKDSKDILVLEETSLAASGQASDEVKIEMKSEEVSEVLGSLLCQETIPGSPTQVPEPASDEAIEDEKVLLLEMPFASVPGSNCDLPATAEQVSVPVPLPESSPMLPLPLCSPPVVVQPSSPSVSKRNSNEAVSVMDNTPPTTPDSTLSTISGSPREEHGDMSPALDNESTKSHRDSFEIDMDSCAEGTKVDHFSEDDSLLNVEVSNSSDNRLQGLKVIPKRPCLDLDKEMESSPKKRRRSRKRSECESNKRLRHSSGRSPRTLGCAGSDSDDTSENSATGCMTVTSSENTLSSRSPRPSKYNFYVELAPELDGSQRIALLQQKLQELRKTYMNVKAELACIDRRRKKLRRREREEKATKQEVACS